ncbi:sensitivity to high expression protein she9 [Lobulomyces angularis]|nr:sensitivity to high expression protein she9 [Lobulomyces angularis]
MRDSSARVSPQLEASNSVAYLNNTLLPKLSEKINSVTGYDKLDKLKFSVQKRDQELFEAKKLFQIAKKNYEEVIEKRRKSQEQMTSLHQRKDSWTDSDLNLFTELYRKSINLEQEEINAKQDYQLKNDEFETAHVKYLNEVRERYIEEQLFSDKIRQLSTYWTWGLISIHLTIFIVLNLIIEPKKREKFKQDIVNLIDLSKKEELQLLRNNIIEEEKSFSQSIPQEEGVLVPEELTSVKNDEEVCSKPSWIYKIFPNEPQFIGGLVFGSFMTSTVAFIINRFS